MHEVPILDGSTITHTTKTMAATTITTMAMSATVALNAADWFVKIGGWFTFA